jgi:AraC family transcriptional regulator of adaptative response/methylated-DNA-[protein]-cysteine methyltransferase
MSTHYATDQERWEAVAHRDPSAEGAFVYAVTTTGVYCRPGCASRRPKRENARFFDSAAQAEAAGYRACKRCTPGAETVQDRQRQAVVRACRMIAAALDTGDEPPVLAELAAAVSLSASYFHRLFKRYVGVTPKQYAMEERARRARGALTESSSVTDALYEAGYRSSSRFYEEARSTLGMKPAAYKNGGSGARIRYSVAPCELGWVLVAAAERGVCAIYVGDEPGELAERLQARFPQAASVRDDPDLARWVGAAVLFVEAPQDGLDLPLEIRGTAFQRQVWTALREIPLGETASYGEVAARIGRPTAARAVARACAANELALAVPCHRVVRSDGSVGGYRWGTERKERLLEREAEVADRP